MSVCCMRRARCPITNGYYVKSEGHACHIIIIIIIIKFGEGANVVVVTC